ncbi:methyltransferase [Actinosynnema sp. NPDC047251]
MAFADHDHRPGEPGLPLSGPAAGFAHGAARPGGDLAHAHALAMADLATPMSLRVAVTLGLPDRLRGAGAAVADLAADVGASPLALDVLPAHLAALGMVERTPAGYRTTERGTALCADADNRVADLADRPRLRETFDRQMTDRLPAMVAGYDWGRFATLVDVGGGRGTLLAAILAAHPALRGHLVDLDPTAAEAARTFAGHGVGDRARVTAGSFFDPLPPGADAYLLCDVLHDWDDEHAHLVLARCAEAAGPTGRVLVLEPVGGRQAGTIGDLAMPAIFGGRERRVEEFRAPASAHGLVLDTVTDLAGRCLLEFHAAS